MQNKNCAINTVAIVSCLLNAFLIGLIVAHEGPPRPGLRPMPPPHEFLFMRMEQAAQELPPQEAAKVQKIIAGKKSRIDADMEAMHAGMPQMDALMTAPKLDKKKLETQNAAMAKAEEALRTDMFGMMGDIAAALPDAERVKFFKQIAPPHGPGRNHGDHHHGEDEPRTDDMHPPL